MYVDNRDTYVDNRRKCVVGIHMGINTHTHTHTHMCVDDNSSFVGI